MGYPKYIEELIEVTNDMWLQGWNEYNGGNVSYRLSKAEIENLETDLSNTDFRIYSESEEVKVIPIPQNIQGHYLFITATFSHFRKLKHQVSVDSGIIRLTDKGYVKVAGFNTGKNPTSEIFMHILAHSTRMKYDKNSRVVIHNHANNIVLYSLLNGVTSESLTIDLWSVLTESIVVFPDGIGVLAWDVPGTESLGRATAKLLHEHRLVVWSQHGVLSTGRDYQDCFGLIETANKAAGISLKLQQISGKPVSENNVLTKDNLRDVCRVLGVDGKYL